MRAPTPIHASDHRRGGPDPLPVRAVLHIKVFPDNPSVPESIVTAGNNKFVFIVAEDMAGLSLNRLEAFVTTVSSSGNLSILVRNRTQAVSLGSVRVDAGELNSRTATTPMTIFPGVENEWGEEIAIDVSAAGAAARGLGVILEFT